MPSKLSGIMMIGGVSFSWITFFTPIASYIDCNFGFLKELFTQCEPNVFSFEFLLQVAAQIFISLDMMSATMTYVTVMTQETTFHFRETTKCLLRTNFRSQYERLEAFQLFRELKVLENRVNSTLGPEVFSILLTCMMGGCIICLSIFIRQYQHNPMLGFISFSYTSWCLVVLIVFYGQMAMATAISEKFLGALFQNICSKYERKLIVTFRPIKFKVGIFFPVRLGVILQILNIVVVYTSTLLMAT